MSLYPSLEDMKVDQLAKAQVQAANAGHALPPATASAPGSSTGHSGLYPSLDDYMGLHITEQMVRDNVPGYQVVPSGGRQLATVASGAIAPVTGANNIDVKRSEIKQGVREVTLCKDAKGKVGLRVRHVNKGVFVSYVHSNSPAALGGLRFGDQILQIDGDTVAGYEMDKVMKILKKASPQKIVFAVRDRPFERTITLQKDSNGNVGFVFKDGKVTAIAKESSAARNGLLTEHNLVEVNGQNVVGLKDKEIKEIIARADRSVTFTIVPTFVFKHIMKNMSTSLVKGSMDHSIPDI
ncbi:syntenin-1-like [Dendronephthya gigantea]|uniref:syntenin-1-like n=1 Tax=Dendronephthya gigantea TaxID=151771 RepID=UPI001069C153|nr:syntenin-1-like [Dendronephthya gigantea]